MFSEPARHRRLAIPRRLRHSSPSRAFADQNYWYSIKKYRVTTVCYGSLEFLAIFLLRRAEYERTFPSGKDDSASATRLHSRILDERRGIGVYPH